MALKFERELAEKSEQEVENILARTTKFLTEANCTPLGMSKLTEMWDLAQTESVSLAQHQLETTGKRKRGETNRVRKHLTDLQLYTFSHRPKGVGRKRARRANRTCTQNISKLRGQTWQKHDSSRNHGRTRKSEEHVDRRML